MRKFFVGGNWTPHPKTIKAADDLITLLNGAKINAPVEIVVGTLFPFLPLLKQKL
jgi:hypothetical protein